MQQHIVFVGAWWAWVSSLVLLFCKLWIQHIVAIDSNESELTKKLSQAWVKVIIWHGNYSVQQDDIIIYSDAASWSPEVQAAEKKMLQNRKKIFAPRTYFEFLWEISKYMTTVSIAGTHGKSTTTWLCASILEKYHSNFWLSIVWAPINQRWHQNFLLWKEAIEPVRSIIEHILFPKWPVVWKNMKKLLFVVEADEYNHHFLHLDTDYGCITNIELDHADVYSSFENYLETFITFAERVRHDIFIGKDCLWYTKFINKVKHNRIHTAPKKQFSFSTLLWAHNHANASLALACAEHLCPHIDTSLLAQELNNFQGLRRRWEHLWVNTHNIPIISDYAHHPSELKSTLAAIRESHPSKQITLIFQPHQARRVVEFWDQFIRACNNADHVHVYSIYTARETIEQAKTYTMWSDEVQQLMERLSSFEELWTALAHSANWIYHTSLTTLQETINQTNTWIILMCTAWDLDWKVRTLVTSKNLKYNQ